MLFAKNYEQNKLGEWMLPFGLLTKPDLHTFFCARACV